MTAPDGSRPDVRFGQKSPGTNAPRPFGPMGVALGAALVALVVGGMAWSALAARPAAAQRPSIFGGSLVLGDTRPLTVIDVATGQITVRLDGIDAQVGAANYGDVQPVAVDGGTVLVSRVTGSFNFLGADDFVDDPNGPGVSLGTLAGATGAEGVADGPDAYLLRSGPTSTVALVGSETVLAAARTTTAAGGTPVTPLGSATVAGPLDLSDAGTAVSEGSLWALYGRGAGCGVLELTPVATSREGLVASDRAGSGAACGRDALDSDGSAVGLASPGHVELFGPGPGHTTLATPFTTSATNFLAVTGAAGQFWFLAGGPGGWQLFGIDGAGRTAARTTGPFALRDLPASADPAAPVLAGGFLYTLDQAQSPQPALWTIDVANGHMAPLAGVDRYPILSATERDDFRGVQILLDGPRVVFNNPGSLEAVVVFTDGSRPPVVVNKSLAVDVSATGPADLDGEPGAAGPGRSPAQARSDKAPTVPVVAPVSQQVTCAKTTQKPYAPQITALTPSSETVLVQWSYQLLDQTDCEPDSWAVQVTALNGGHPPRQPTQLVTGQDQHIFTGLRPTTTYQVVVTAYINSQSTPSSPATFTTAARGPDAPVSVQTVADGHGDWVVSWTPCTDPNCVVPAAQWAVIGASCGGGFVGTPPTVQVPGGATSVVISADDLQLLGDSLSFSVQGSLPSGLTGNPTTDDECTQAWEAPTASELSVSSSGNEAADKTITATVVAGASGDLAGLLQTHRSEVQFVYQLAGQVTGPTSASSTTFTGVPAGSTFTPSVTVYPAGHRAASITVEGPPFAQTLSWPPESASANATVDPSNPDQGRVTVTLPANTPQPVQVTNPDPSDAPGAGPVLQCGGPSGATSTLPIEPLGPGHSFSFSMTDLIDTGGQCALRFTLTDTADPDPYGVPSPQIEADFTIGQIPKYQFMQGYAPDCSSDSQTGNQCGPGGQQWQLVVAAAGGKAPDMGGGDWTVTAEVTNPHNGQEVTPDLCYVSSGLDPSDFPFTITLPEACPYPQMDDIDATVSFKYLGQTTDVDAGYPDNKQGAFVPEPTTTTSTTSTTVVSSESITNASGVTAPAVSAGATLGGVTAIASLRRRRSRRAATVPTPPGREETDERKP